MTRKDYAALAQLLAESDWHDMSDAIDGIATMLQKSNPRFNRIRFVNAATKAMTIPQCYPRGESK